MCTRRHFFSGVLIQSLCGALKLASGSSPFPSSVGGSKVPPTFASGFTLAFDQQEVALSCECQCLGLLRPPSCTNVLGSLRCCGKGDVGGGAANSAKHGAHSETTCSSLPSHCASQGHNCTCDPRSQWSRATDSYTMTVSWSLQATSFGVGCSQ